MASNQLPVAEKAKIISENFRVPMEDVEQIKRKESIYHTALETYINQGNRQIPFEMVREIQKKEVKDSTFLELKIRYNDPELGILPDWFDVEEAQTIVKKAVNAKWQDVLYPTYDRNDMFSECWTKILLATKRIKEVGEQNYKGFIYRIATNHVTYTTYYHVRHLKHFKTNISSSELDTIHTKLDSSNIKRLPEAIYNLNETDKEIREEEKTIYLPVTERVETYEDRVLDTLEAEMDMLNTIKSINDTTIKDLLSIAAYLLANIECFEGLYKEAVDRLIEPKKKKFLEVVECKDGKCIDFKKITKIVVGKETNTYLSLINDYLHNMMREPEKLLEV